MSVLFVAKCRNNALSVHQLMDAKGGGHSGGGADTEGVASRAARLDGVASCGGGSWARRQGVNVISAGGDEVVVTIQLIPSRGSRDALLNCGLVCGRCAWVAALVKKSVGLAHYFFVLRREDLVCRDGHG